MPPADPLSDTAPEAHRRWIEHWRSVSPEEKLATVGRLNAAVLALAAARQASWYPNDTAEERRLRLASLWLDRDTMIGRFGWDPEIRGR